MTIWRMRIACWIPKATNTHSQYVTLTAFTISNGYANAPRYYVIRAFSVLFMKRFGLEIFLWACAQNVLAYS